MGVIIKILVGNKIFVKQCRNRETTLLFNLYLEEKKRRRRGEGSWKRGERKRGEEKRRLIRLMSAFQGSPDRKPKP